MIKTSNCRLIRPRKMYRFQEKSKGHRCHQLYFPPHGQKPVERTLGEEKRPSGG